MRCSYYIPKVLYESMERIGRSGVGFGGVDPRALFIPSCPGTTGLTGAPDWSDRCEPLVGFIRWTTWILCLWAVLLLVNSWAVWCCFCSALWRVLLPCRLCFGGVSVPGPREVIEALWNVCCATAVATDLTGSVHWSDRCHRSDRAQAIDLTGVA
jgi:hypothetical protein